MPIPKWLQRLSNATIKASIAENPAVATASGWTINNSEAQQNATEEPGVQRLRDNLTVLGGIATGIVASPVIGTGLSSIAVRNAIGDASVSMLGGEAVNTIHKALTGQSFGRGVASIFNADGIYDRSALARFGFDTANPGYWLGGFMMNRIKPAINNSVAILASKGNFTRRNPDYYVGRPKDLMFDFNRGRKTAWGYLGSQRKTAIDTHNKDILTRITKDPTSFQIEQLPQQRSMTPMQKPQAGMQMSDGSWINLGDNGFFLYKGKGNEAGLTFRVKGAPEKDQMYLTTDFDLDDTAFHEYLHRGNMGVGFNGPTQWLYDWKNRSILKPGFENFREGYLTNPEETAVNLLEIGRRADVINTPYPGPEKAKSIIQDIIKNDLEKGSILDQTKWETKPKRVWDALQGRYIGLIPLGIGSSLMLNNGNE